MNVMSADERQELMNLYEDLRVADVRDGLDTLMHHHVGSMRPEVRPIWRTRAWGVARTARHVPFTGTIPALSPADYWAWSGEYYAKVNPYPWMEAVQPGDFCVIDQSGVNCGLMGSNNSLAGMRSGVRGYVTNGGVRDTDELILQRVPFWSVLVSQSMVQGRLQFDAMDIPVEVGGVLVSPGDMIMADGDGVVAVPRRIARAVARWAHEEHQRDKAARRKLYEAMGLPPDQTV